MNRVFIYKEFDKIKKHKNHIIFICDHASNHIPKRFFNLGLKKKKLSSHIAWDIGAKKISINLAKKLNQSYYLSNFSRLLIDPNRKITSVDLIVKKSFNVQIPGNENINHNLKKKRIENFYQPYHYNLKKIIQKKKKNYKKIILVSIHSFTKKSEMIDRGTEIGLLWNKNMNLFLPTFKMLKNRNIHVGNNYPYSGFFYNYTLDTHSENGLLDNLSIEFRNDLICKKKDINNWSMIFYNIFKDILND